jgi:RHS repeat-associated protein
MFAPALLDLRPAGAAHANLRYDPLGRLFESSSNGGNYIRRLYAGEALVMDYTLNSYDPPLRRFVHGDGPGDDPLAWFEGGGMDPTQRRDLVTDRLGSVIAVAGPGMATPALNAYDEYGVPAAGNLGGFQYTGQAWVPEAGVYYYKARMYAPALGRFLQSDPVGYDGGMNLYAYVGGDPVNFVDPWGEDIVVTADRLKPDNGSGDNIIGGSTRLGAPAKVQIPGAQLSGQDGDQARPIIVTGHVLNAQIKGERGKAAKPTGTKNPEKKYKPGLKPGTRIFTDPHSGKKTVKPWPDDPRLDRPILSSQSALIGAGVVVIGGIVIILASPQIAAALTVAGGVSILVN